MADEADFNDVLDNIFLREETQHKESYEEGLKAGSAAGNPEGFHLGYHRGAELGRELGYYYGTVSQYLENNEKSATKYSEKLLNQLIKVKDLVDAFPRDNSEDQDILGMAENIRAQYKKACAMLKISSANPYDAGVFNPTLRMSFFFKMDSTISRLHKNLDASLKYLTPLLPIANCHMVEFLTDNYWQKLVPRSLTASLEHLELNDAVEYFWKSVNGCDTPITELDKWIRDAQGHCVKANNDYCLTREQLQHRMKRWGGQIKPEVKVKDFMSSKKSYEVQSMCGLVASLYEATKSSCCVEVGGGRGPLLAALTLSYGVPSLTVDCDANAVMAAKRRSAIMKKQWHAIAKNLGGTITKAAVDQKGSLHRFASAFVTSHTDLAAVARQLFPEYRDGMKLLLTGLHTCGNLGPDSLRIFTRQATTAAVFNVPCCYHLLSEDIDEDGLFDVFQRDFGDGKTGVGEAGFPMSQYLKGVNLGRNARMLAAQSIDRVVDLRQLPSRSLLYRALLQVIIKKYIPNATLSEGKLKRTSKCENFEQYFKMADSVLQLNLFDTLPDKIYLIELNQDLDEHWKKLVLFYLLRLCLAQVIESVILLDRLLYLKENGFENVFLVKLFDPVLSPRCHSIVAVR